jgi:two-component system, sensor histidine kinase
MKKPRFSLGAAVRDIGSERAEAEQIEVLFRNAAVGVIAAASAAAVLGPAFARLGVLPVSVGILWAACIACCAIAHLALRASYRRMPAPGRQRRRRWAIIFTIIAFAEGAAWGALPIMLAPAGEFALEMLGAVVTVTVAAGAIPAFGSYLPAFAALFLPATLPYAFYNAWVGGVLHDSAAALMVIFIFGMGGLGLQFNRNFAALIGLQLEKDQLAESLLRQKELAERANFEKSKFLAAASHDLRQPVHALGLFVAALRGVQVSPQAARLIGEIDASVTALDDLFSALLDMSQLDAGIVLVRRQIFPIQPLLARIVRDYAKEADEKSLTVVLRESSAFVETDPLLLERVLRNLLANAVRYTQRGRILVGCRRGGGVLTIQIWDTGPGIPVKERERIFQEFFQIENGERDRSKGLGLGLAIVRRLSNLLACPLIVRSEVGKGSCFGISVPRVAASKVEPAPAPVAGALRRGFIVVVDDEASVQQAMDNLLRSWGHEVIAAPSGDILMDRLADLPARPDLIIVDYRLQGEETGVSVVNRLHAEYNTSIPAIMITADTDRDRLTEAKASGILVLHKPVASSRLRTAIGNLMKADNPALAD